MMTIVRYEISDQWDQSFFKTFHLPTFLPRPVDQFFDGLTTFFKGLAQECFAIGSVSIKHLAFLENILRGRFKPAHANIRYLSQLLIHCSSSPSAQRFVHVIVGNV